MMYLEKKSVFIFVTPLQIDFEYMGQNTFLCFLLNEPNIILKHWEGEEKFSISFEIDHSMLRHKPRSK